MGYKDIGAVWHEFPNGGGCLTYEEVPRQPRCSQCGQLVINSSPVLPRIKQRIFDVIRHRPGISAEALRNLVWADDIDGGPETLSCLHVHVHQMNRILQPHGLAVRGHPTGGYRICERNLRWQS